VFPKAINAPFMELRFRWVTTDTPPRKSNVELKANMMYVKINHQTPRYSVMDARTSESSDRETRVDPRTSDHTNPGARAVEQKPTGPQIVGLEETRRNLTLTSVNKTITTAKTRGTNQWDETTIGPKEKDKAYYAHSRTRSPSTDSCSQSNISATAIETSTINQCVSSPNSLL